MKNFIKKNKYTILVFLFFVFIRLPDLGHDVFNTDVWKWKSRTYDFGEGIFTNQYEKTLQKYHPGVTLMWLGTIGVKINSFYHKIILGELPADNLVSSVFLLHTIQKTVIVVALGILVAIIYQQLEYLFGKKYAFFAISIITLEPFYVALTRVMHLEGLMTTFMLASFIFIYRYLQDHKNKFFVISSIFGGLAFLTKTSSLFLLMYVGLIFFVESVKEHKTIKESLIPTVKKTLFWWLVSFATFFLLWPIMWTQPFTALEYLAKGIFSVGVENNHLQLYLGKWVESPGYLYYLVVLMFRSSLVLVFGVIAFFALIKGIFRDPRKKWFFIYVFAFIVFYTLELSIPSKKLDRYILPTLVMFGLMAAEGVSRLLEKLKSKQRYLLVLSFLSFYAVTLVSLHANYFAYYSPLLGGLSKGIYAIEPKWMIGQKEVADHFKNNPRYANYVRFPEDQSLDSQLYKSDIETRFTIAFKEKYYTQVWPFIHEIGARATIKDLTPQAVRTNFFVYPVYDDDSSSEDRFDIKLIDTIQVNGVDLYNVYQRIEE